ncbi:hypothetical protein JXD20_03450 [Candidatus Peregrinibacteria bacterium]|nr:hypothetical protein [Candidatus Peregrinibacteria bacterium]
MPRENLDELDNLGDRERRDLQDAAEHAQSLKITLLMQQGFRQLLFPTGTFLQLQEFERVRGILTANPDIESHIISHADGMLVYVKPEVIALLQVRGDIRMVVSDQKE